MYNLPIDSPGFYVYVRRKDGTVWSPTYRPVNTPLDRWTAVHQPGRTTFMARKGDLETKLSLFITPDYDTVVWDLDITNLSEIITEVDIFAYIELSTLCLG